MEIILGYLFFSFVLCIFNQKYPKLNAILIFVVGVFISGWRSISFGIDNRAYAEYYEMNSHYTLAQSWSMVVGQVGKDPFYYFVGNIFSKLGFTYRGWFVFIAIVYMGGFCYIMSKYSKNQFISMLFFVSQMYFYFSMTGLRQTLAMGICFFAIDFAYRKRIVSFITLVVLASAFHSSALILIAFYIMKHWKIGIKQWMLVVTAMFLAVFIPSVINSLVETLAWDENLANYAEVTTGLSWGGFIIQFFVLVFWLYFVKKTILEEDKRFWSNLLFLGLFFQTFSVNIDNIFRMSMYFGVYGAITIPNAIALQKNARNRMLLYTCVSLALILYLFQSGRWTNFTMFGGI